MVGSNNVRVAVACQGGGAQTAFTAGALSYLLKHHSDQNSARRFEITALSGTSGGAVCAALAWRDLLLPYDRREMPTVERFWTTAYPDGNASRILPQAIFLDLFSLILEGRLPFLHTLDRWRTDVSQIFLRMPSKLTAWSPMDVKPEFGHYAFARMFDRVDSLMPSFLLAPATELIRANLSLMKQLLPVPHAANFIGDMVDLLPFHKTSVIRDDQPSLIRRELDVQDAFRAVLDREGYFDERTLAELQKAVRETALVPELLIAAADAQRVHEPDDRSSTVEKISPSPPSDPPGPDADSIRRAQAQVAAAREEGLRLEEHRHHRASRTNLRLFRGTRDPGRVVDWILASAAIPTAMRGVELDGATLWDGLFSSNPPIYDLPDVHGHEPEAMARNPEQIWVIRINPTQRADRPDTAPEIEDRRNEMAGNLPLMQEIRHVLAIGGAWKGRRYYRPIVFGFIDMDETIAEHLDYATKADKRTEAIELLFDHGYCQAKDFHQRWVAI